MLPKLSYLSSGQFTFCDNNTKLKTNSKYLNKSPEYNGNKQADVDLEKIQKANTKDKDKRIPYYIGLDKDLCDESKLNKDCLNLTNNSHDNKCNSLILDKNLEKQNNLNISCGSYKKTFLFDKQSLSSCSTSSISSCTNSSFSSPNSDCRLPNSDSDSLTFVSLVSPIDCFNSFNNYSEKKSDYSDEKKEEISIVAEQNLLMKDLKVKSESTTRDSNTLLTIDQPTPTMSADLIKQKTLLRKNNFEEQKKFMKKMVESPNEFELNPNNSSTSSALSIFEIENSNFENDLSLIQSKLESSQLSILSKDKLVIDGSNRSPTSSYSSLLIVSRHGTVRGAVNHVKTSLKEIFKEPQITNPVTNAQLNIKSNNTILSPLSAKSNEKLYLHYYLARDYEVEEHMKIVIYTTSLQVVRLSFDKCKRVKKILQNHCVRYEEKDLYKNKEYQRELKFRLNLKQIDVPHIFFDGKHVGNCDELELFSDQGVLNKLFKDLEKIKLRIYCSKCGGYRFVLCTLCSGSKRKYNNFANLKCTHCNEDGLIRCDECLDQQE